MTALYSVPIQRADGTTTTLADYRGSVLLIVNVASECGLTPQYTGLESIYERYRGRGLVVLGFPCNDFGAQEPGTAEQIQTFCRTTFGVEFPVLAKITVAPAARHPLYRELIAEQPHARDAAGKAGAGSDVAWNFEKFLVSRDGQAVARFAPQVVPDDPVVLAAIEQQLG